MLAGEHTDPETRFFTAVDLVGMSEEQAMKLWSFYETLREDQRKRAVGSWETAIVFVLMREDLLVELSLFESISSHPWRFFIGPSSARLEEEFRRSLLMSFLQEVSLRVQRCIQRLNRLWFAELTFNGM